LYALPPSQFVAARDELIKAARARQDGTTATALSRLHRPTTSAWLVNQLYRQERDAVEALLEIGEQLTEASRQLSGPQLQQLSAQRAQVVQALVGQARRLASEAGVAVSAATAYEVQSTLSAALAEPSVADEVRSGRMLRPASYAGFGPDLAPAPAGSPRTPSRSASRSAGSPPAQKKGDRRGSDQLARRRARTQQELDESRAAAELAESQLREAEAALAEAQRMSGVLAEDHESLSAQLADLEHRQQRAAQRTAAAERALRKVVARRETAQRKFNEARRRASEAD
jgi:hypothetical protein